MTQEKNILPAIIAHCKEYGFVFSSSDIYDGLSAVYDYGPNGVELKNNIKEYWWKSMVRMHDNIVGIDAAIFMHPATWKASGHIDNFSDPMIDNKESKKRYRVDHLIEAHAATLSSTEGESLLKKMDELLVANDYDGLLQLIQTCGISCAVSGTKNWTEIRQFNLMFSTKVGSVAEEASEVYLRPETAQGIFVNFLNVQKTARMKIPFGIAQIGKAFRNEIIARQFIFRMREFEQMEMQFFIKPGTQKEWFEHWKQTRLDWHLKLGFAKEKYRFHNHVKLAHYADAALDIEFDFPFGFKELEGIHSRTDFDLSSHQTLSGKKLTYFDTDENKHYVPYVIETSIGLDRTFLMVLSASYCEEKTTTTDGAEDTRIVLKFPPALAPTKLAILPLTKKDGLPELAKLISMECKPHFACFYDEKDSIGKRYRRQDAIGTPFCITIDHQSLEDKTITIRHRDSMTQERMPIAKIKDFVLEKIQLI